MWIYRVEIIHMLDHQFYGTISDHGLRRRIAEHAVEQLEKAMLESTEECAQLTARMNIYVQRKAAMAYVEEFGRLLRADIEAAAEKHLLATLGPRVAALEKKVGP